MKAHARPGPPHLPWKELELLCSEAGKEGWALGEDRNALRSPGPSSFQRHCHPPLPSQGSAGPQRFSLACGSWASALGGGQAFWASQFQQSALITLFPEQDMFLVISHQTPRILQQKPQNASTPVLI